MFLFFETVKNISQREWLHILLLVSAFCFSSDVRKHKLGFRPCSVWNVYKCSESTTSNESVL